MDRKPTRIFGDSEGCAQLTTKNILFYRTKHIDVKYQMIVDRFKNNLIQAESIASRAIIADMMTKSLEKFY